MNDEKCDTVVTTSKVGREAEIGKNINYQGIPYYLSQMNEFVRTFAAKVNEIFMSGYDVNGDNGAIFFTARKPIAGETIIDSQYDIDAFTKDDDKYYEMTAFNLEISDLLMDNAELLGTRSSADIGVEECGKVTELIEALKDKSKFSFRNATAGEFLQSILSDVALNASNAETFLIHTMELQSQLKIRELPFPV